MARTDTFGLDFGTTNTVMARPTAAGTADAITFAHENKAFSAFRSVLSIWQERDEAGLGARTEAGPWAIDRFISDPHDTRFLQSFKTFAASKAFQQTTIAGRNYVFEDLLAGFFQKFRAHGGAALETLPKRIVLGRPVAFAGARPDAALAAKRYETAFSRFGFTEFHHVYEPVAAAFFFAQRLKQPATVLVADFGGGTSDFSIVHFKPTPNGIDAKPLGHSGVGIAGDTFDYRIIDTIVSPRLGKGTRYTSWGKVLDVPGHYYANFARWNQLSLLKSQKIMTELKQLARDSLAPDKLEALIAFIDADVGYPLYQAVSDTKVALSTSDRARLRFVTRGITIDEVIERSAFEKWIARDLDRIDQAVADVLDRAGLGVKDIDRVFLTGGTSFVPAVRRRFETRFGAPKIETGDQLLSIAYGLALIGGLDDLTPWTVTAEVAPSADTEDD